MTHAQKLQWLRIHVDPALPDIYAIDGFIPNGCGPACWPIDLVPDVLPFLPDWSVAGDYHDYLYWRGGNDADRKHADQELARLMLARVAWWRLIARARMRCLALIYYKFVRKYGWKFFNCGGRPNP